MAHTYGTKARLPATATTTNANPATFTINCPSGTTVLWLGIVVGGTTARSGGSPTYNSSAMTASVAKTNAGGTAETCAETWYMLDPPTGSSYTISVPNSGTLAMTLIAATGSAPSGGTSAKANNGVATQGNSTNPSGSGPAGCIGDIEFSIVGNGATTWNPSGRSGTQLYDWDAGSWGVGAQYIVSTGTGASTHSWTFGTSEDWIIEVDRFTQASGSLTPTGQAGTSGYGKSGTNTFESWTLDKAFDSSQTYSTGTLGAFATLAVDKGITTVAGTGETKDPRPDNDKALVGSEATSAAGTLGAEIGYSVDLTGQEAGSTLGSLGVEAESSLSGSATSSTQGDVSTSFSLEALGSGATSALGAIPAEVAIVVEGRGSAGEAGTVGVDINYDTVIELFGMSAAAFRGSVEAFPEYEALLSGVSSPGEVGTASASINYGALLVGCYVDGRVGDLGPWIAQEALMLGHEAQAGIGVFDSLYKDHGLAWVPWGDAYLERILFSRRR